MNDYLKSKIAELIKINLRSSRENPALEDRLVRLLRPSTGGIEEHSIAIRKKIRQSILNNLGSKSDGPMVVAEFERICENLRRLNSNILTPFLALIEPLCFSLVKVNYFSKQLQQSDSDDIAVKTLDETKIKSDEFVVLHTDKALGLIASEYLWISKDTELKLIKASVIFIYYYFSFSDGSLRERL